MNWPQGKLHLLGRAMGSCLAWLCSAVIKHVPCCKLQLLPQMAPGAGARYIFETITWALDQVQ